MTPKNSTPFSVLVSLVALAALPLFAAAQTAGAPDGGGSQSNTCTITDLASVFTCGLTLINSYVVPVIFAIAFVVFIIGIYRYFIAGGGSDEKVKEGQKFLLWSIIGFVIMFSLWGIVNIFVNTFGLNNASRPAFPTFNATTNSTPGTPGAGATPGSTPGSTPGTTCPAGQVPQNGTCVPFGQAQGLTNL